MFKFIKRVIDKYRYNREFKYNKAHPEKCHHKYGLRSHGYRTLYCNCCNKPIYYIAITGHVGK